MTAILAGAVTFVLTALLTIAGVAAAFVLIPVFLALGIEVHTAMATALLVNAVGLSVASVNFIRRQLVVWRVALPMMAIASVLSPLGASVNRGLDRPVLLSLFVGFALFAALVMLFYTPRAREPSANSPLLLVVGLGVGGLAGFLCGLLGVAGGSIIVPALVALGVDPKKASASTALVVIFSSLTGFLSHLSLAMDYGLLGWTAAGSAAGAALGSWLLADRLDGRRVKPLVGLVLLGIAAKLALDLN